MFKALVFLTLISFSVSYKILAVLQVSSGSHYILANKLFSELAKHGHEVTFITPIARKTPLRNLKEIHVPSLQKGFQATSFVNLENITLVEKANFITSVSNKWTETLLSSNEFQELLKSDAKFDAVLIYQYLNDALMALGNHFKAPVILFKSMPLYVPESFMLSHPNPSSYVPNILTEYTGRMNFWQRLRNSFIDLYMIFQYQVFTLPLHRQLVYKYFPGKPDLYQFLHNASLLLINSHVSTNEAIPLVPNAIEIGGYHIEEPKALPEDLKQFIENSPNGVILFSMGTIARSTDIDIGRRTTLIRTLSKLKQNVIWKFEDDLPNLPKNIKVMKWVPQADVLAHPNVVAFISHGGLLSTLESVYFAKPIVGIPLFVDQKMNMALATSYEYAIEVPYRDITEERLSKAIDDILHNPKFKENIKKRSKILRDRPIKPLDSALYWIDYVIRHDGATHLRYPGMDLNWFQRNLLDVAAFVSILAILLVICLAKVVKRICCKNEYKKKKD